MVQLGLRRRLYATASLLTAAVILSLLAGTTPGSVFTSAAARRRTSTVDLGPLELPRHIHKTRLSGTSTRKPRIALLEHTGWHDEVAGALIKTLEDVGANYTVFRNEYRWNFESILRSFLPHIPAPSKRMQFVDNASDYDIVIHSSCDITWRYCMPESLSNLLDNNDHLREICILHQLESLSKKETEPWRHLVQEGRMELMTLSPHTTRFLRRQIEMWSTEQADVALATVPVHTLIPIFPVNIDKIPIPPNSIIPHIPARNVDRIPSRIAILGNILPTRRRYKSLIQDLHKAITDDPAAWGYREPRGAAATFVSADDPARPPFHLYLVGHIATDVKLDIPESMTDMITLTPDLPYADFYRLISSMDLVVPAFKGYTYVDKKLSAAIPAAVLSKVPILATPLVLEAYSFLRPPAVILHPSGTSEIEAIRLLRDYRNPMSLLASTSVQLAYTDWQQGMFGSNEQWEAYHQTLYHANADVLREIIERDNVRATM